MSKSNWDEVVGKFSRLIFLHSSRSLTLLQKVAFLNIFALSKVWYLASILATTNAHTAKLTSIMTTFLWRGLPARIPIHQLARPHEHGGLNLHLPVFKCKSLFINRHLKQMDYMPYYKTILQDNFSSANMPTNCPCLRLLKHHLPLIPAVILRNHSAESIYHHYVESTETPKVERENPTIDWRRAWLNVLRERELSSQQKSLLFVFVNEKVAHRRLMFIIRRADGENCEHCPEPVETVEHKFAICPRVADAWVLLQQLISSLLPGRRLFTFRDISRPTLNSVPKRVKPELLKLIANYVHFIINCDTVIDIGALKFELENNL